MPVRCEPRRGAIPRRGVLMAALALACGSQEAPAPPAGFAHAAAGRNCGPADGPAVSIYLTPQPVDRLDPAPPFVHLYLWRGLWDLAGRTWSLAGNEAEGSAQYCAAAGQCESASSGSIRITAVDADSTIRASVTLRFPGAGEIGGGIVARWISRTMVYCG
ncbi:MAG TPA: hypothetical protein VFH97_09760 [Gemmatimonadales bacterium]|nr:hypothetical protein [Gemmatimonadales bacterium]